MTRERIAHDETPCNNPLMTERPKFAARLRHARRSRELTLAQVGKHLGYETSFICDVEAGKRLPPRSPVLIRWAKFVGADPAVVVAESGRPLEVAAGDEGTIRAVMELVAL